LVKRGWRRKQRLRDKKAYEYKVVEEKGDIRSKAPMLLNGTRKPLLYR
jgi:hypothetical protein